MSEAILTASNLVKTYQQRTGKYGLSTTLVNALDDVSIQIKVGGTMAVVGESGSGKSTLARCLLQLMPLNKGKVLFQGRDLANLTGEELRAARREMQMVFQDPFASLNPRMRVEDIVAEGLLVHGLGDHEERRKKVLNILQRVGLSVADLKKYSHEFSGGQRQRIGIARALVLKPKLVILDEPVSALDVSIQAQILLLLKELQVEMGLSYLFISHDLRVVRHMANEVAVMQYGKIVEQGKVEQIYHAPTSAYTKNLIHSIPGHARSARAG